MPIKPEALNLSEAARYIGVHPRTLQRLAADQANGIIARQLPTGGVRYLRSDLEAWLHALPPRQQPRGAKPKSKGKV